MRFGFYVSNNALRVKKIIHYVSTKKEHGDLLDDFAFVYRDGIFDDDLAALCRKNHIIFCQENISKINKENRAAIVSDNLLSMLEQHKTDYLLVFGSKFLRGKILETYCSRIINFHPSLLPAFQGFKAIDRAIEHGCFLTGNTAHFIDEGHDTGPIIMQNPCIIQDTVDYDRILDNQIPMLLQIIQWAKQSRIRIKDRRVIIEGGKYVLGEFIPGLEDVALQAKTDWDYPSQG